MGEDMAERGRVKRKDAKKRRSEKGMRFVELSF
jgi:hypothetical protein